MANIIKFAHRILLLVMIAYAYSHGLTEGVRVTKLAVKTIKSEDGDVIDCIDMYKQPAFEHPLLKNHKIQMKPNLYPTGMKSDRSGIQITQAWHTSERCPEGTTPILQSRKLDIVKAKFGENFTRSLANQIPHEYAIAGQYEGNFHGGHAFINVWNPTLATSNEFSVSQIWVASGQSNTINTVEAGWQVQPNLFGDSQTRLFIYWTADNYQTTGCYNLDCPGFVQVNNQIVLGSPMKPVATYGATPQAEMSVTIYKDTSTGNWWVQMLDINIGYYPRSIYTSLADSAVTVQWGGEISNSQPQGHHTSTQMGNGHFPYEGFSKTSFMRNLKVIDTSNNFIDPGSLKRTVTKAGCYDLLINQTFPDKHFIYYGGPGLNQNCP